MLRLVPDTACTALAELHDLCLCLVSTCPIASLALFLAFLPPLASLIFILVESCFLLPSEKAQMIKRSETKAPTSSTFVVLFFDQVHHLVFHLSSPLVCPALHSVSSFHLCVFFRHLFVSLPSCPRFFERYLVIVSSSFYHVFSPLCIVSFPFLFVLFRLCFSAMFRTFGVLCFSILMFFLLGYPRRVFIHLFCVW